MTNWECPICGFDTETDEEALINGGVPICPDCDVECGIVESEFEDILEDFLNINKMFIFEGDTGLRNLNIVCEKIGYKQDDYKYGSSLEKFLSDNPGCQEAVVEWIRENSCEEWKENLEHYL